MEKVSGVSPKNNCISATTTTTWWRPHHRNWYSPFPERETLTCTYPWPAHSQLCQINDAGRHGASDGRRQGSSINHLGITIDLPFLSLSALHHQSSYWWWSGLLSFLFFISFQALQKIRLANYIHSLADLLHADVMQQLEVVLLDTAAAKMLEVIAMATSSPQVSVSSRISITSIKLSTTLAPPQVPIAGVIPSSEKSPATEEVRASTSTTDPEGTPAKWHKITPMPLLAKGSDVGSEISKLPSIIVPELAVLTHALPEWINHPGGCKHYKCWICVFQHTNWDCMLTYIWQHLELSVRCPMCGKGFQNAASLCKHGQKIHSVNIVELEHEW